MAEDKQIAEGEEAERVSAAARLFDVRLVIGGLFVVYGLVVGTLGVFDSKAEIDKAQGVRINLWTGLGMLALGLIFLVWHWVRPLVPVAPPDEAGQSTAADS
jgi:xanthine/uracil/vitamin C permease (AzgA family)